MKIPARAPYASVIAPLAPDHDPRHVEAFMRVRHRTLDGLDRLAFHREVRIACECIDQMGAARAEDVARSFGY